MSLDPYNLTPEASLNRVRLVSGAQLHLPQHLDGRTAHSVLSAAAIRELVTESATRHCLPQPDARITELLEGWSALDSQQAQDAAREVIEEHAVRLASLIAALKLGEPAARDARLDWDGSYWSHWSGVRQVDLCGGLATRALATATSNALIASRVECTVNVAPDAALAPLVGAARTARPGCTAAVVLDFGGTTVKRAIATYEGNALLALQQLPPERSPQLAGDRSPHTMAGTVVSTVMEASDQLEGPVQVLLSLASYVRDNHPLASSYVDVSGIENLGRWLSAYASRKLSWPVRVGLLHDGTAAALSLSPASRTAVIVLGTNLGVGFVREDDGGLMRLSPRLQVRARF